MASTPARQSVDDAADSSCTFSKCRVLVFRLLRLNSSDDAFAGSGLSGRQFGKNPTMSESGDIECNR